MKEFNIIKYNKLAILSGLIIWLWGAIPAGSRGAELPRTYSFANGINADIFYPELILDSLTARDETGELVLNLPGGDSYLLVEDIYDPAIANSGSGSFHPLREDNVVQALRDIDVGGRSIGISVEIYILPLPRRYIAQSTSVDNRIFLSPGVYEMGLEITAYIVSHEFGHCFQHHYLPETEGEDWSRYLYLRGILDDPRYSPISMHAYRPQEIFAEDFRFLYGGEASRFTGMIENPELVLPDQLPELQDYFVSLVRGGLASAERTELPDAGAILTRNYPNPFNPSTTITALFAEEMEIGEVEVRIYGPDGSFIRELTDGAAQGREYKTAWDGRDRYGAAAGSGVYFYRLRAGRQMATGKMLLVR
ncbi:MAG: hypothetical protein JXB45_02275 [Candidatus Krumholzibacteriota bacterium]|nr:hypothetical protein [Candidatus Krumholzibacteriota bacterium]